jgi:hypothetical protein
MRSGFFLVADCSSWSILVFWHYAAILGWPISAAQWKTSLLGTNWILTDFQPYFKQSLHVNIILWYLWDKSNICEPQFARYNIQSVCLTKLQQMHSPPKVIIRDTHLVTGGPARLPAQVAGRWGHINWNSVRWVKNYFVLGWPEEPRQEKVSCTGTTNPTNQPRNANF